MHRQIHVGNQTIYEDRWTTYKKNNRSPFQ
jgi:hypothetical protein